MGIVKHFASPLAPLRWSDSIRQKTLKTSVRCSGIGVHGGQTVTMILHPAPADSGIRFRRVDLADASGQAPEITADWRNVVCTRLCTTLGTPDKAVTIGTVEHLIAALAGAEIDNVLIEINGPEVPIMDGSAAPFLFLIDCAGTVEQDAPRRFLRILAPVVAEEGDRMGSLTPLDSDAFRIDFEITFDSAAIGRQEAHFHNSRAAFKNDISRARTFGFLHEVQQLYAMGLARGGSLDNAVVIDGDRVLNEGGLRYEDEFVRHKVLDSIGDLYLAGGQILGGFRGVKAGHAMNRKVLEVLFDTPSAWCWDILPAAAMSLPLSPQDDHEDDHEGDHDREEAAPTLPVSSQDMDYLPLAATG